MKGMVLETCMAVVFFMSLSFSCFIEGDFIDAGLILGIGTVVMVILYNMANKSEHPLMKKLKEMF